MPRGKEVTQTQETMFCKCGCGKIASIAKVTNRKRGHAAGLPVSYIVGHNIKKMGKPIEDCVMPEPNSGCHFWIAHLSSTGYGTRYYLGKERLAHRLMYENEHGKIHDGMTIDHLCRVRSCVNPKHMEVVTRGENTLRGYSPPSENLRKKFCPKCLGPYTKNNQKRRMCVNCNRAYQRNKYAINKLVGAK